MADENESTESLTIAIPADGGEPVVVETPSAAAEPAPTPSPSPDPNDAIAKIKSQLDELTARARAPDPATEEARRQAAEAARLAADAARSVEALANQTKVNQKVETQEREYQTITSALESARAAARQAAQRLAGAQSEGKFDEVAEIQIELGRLGARMEQLETGKAVIEEARRAPPKATAEPTSTREPAPQPQPQQPQPGAWDQPWNENQFNAYIAGRTPATAAWLRSHPEFAGDISLRNKVSGAHSMAIGENLRPDTPEYFARVEELSGLRKPERSEPVSTDPKTKTAPRAPAPAAPPTRTAPSNGSTPSMTEIVLTPEEQKMAKQMFSQDIFRDPKTKLLPSDNEMYTMYARGKQELMRNNEGRMPGNDGVRKAFSER